jgi:hypothetical protein
MTARQRPSGAGYRITHLSKPSQGRAYYRLTVPPSLAERVPEGAIFDPELTEDGILYRIRPGSIPVDKVPRPPRWTVG